MLFNSFLFFSLNRCRCVCMKRIPSYGRQETYMVDSWLSFVSRKTNKITTTATMTNYRCDCNFCVHSIFVVFVRAGVYFKNLTLKAAARKMKAFKPLIISMITILLFVVNFHSFDCIDSWKLLVYFRNWLNFIDFGVNWFKISDITLPRTGKLWINRLQEKSHLPFVKMTQ